MLVVNGDTLLAVYLLHFFGEVLLRLAHASDLDELLRVARTVHERIAGTDFLAVDDCEARHRGHGVGVLFAVVADDVDLAAPAIVLADAHDT